MRIKKLKHSYIFKQEFKICGYYVSNKFKCYSASGRIRGMLITSQTVPVTEILSNYIGYEFYC